MGGPLETTILNLCVAAADAASNNTKKPLRILVFRKFDFCDISRLSQPNSSRNIYTHDSVLIDIE